MKDRVLYQSEVKKKNKIQELIDPWGAPVISRCRSFKVCHLKTGATTLVDQVCFLCNAFEIPGLVRLRSFFNNRYKNITLFFQF